MSPLKVGKLRGTGSAINVSIGWVPDMVWISNQTDGDLYTVGWLENVIPFTSGGAFEIKRGMTIKGATGGATAIVQEVILDAGSWAGTDASGWIILDLPTKRGTFQTESVYVIASSAFAASGTADDATIVVDKNYNQAVAAAVAAATGNAAISAYLGDASTGAAAGFTVGSTVSEDAKLLTFIAFRNTDGSKATCNNPG